MNSQRVPIAVKAKQDVASCLIIVENLPVPFDRRVWQEAQALAGAGWQVSVVCPKSTVHPEIEEVIDGIFIYRHPVPLEARGRFSFIVEYAHALYHEMRLALKVFRRHGIEVIHACNPPDLIFLVALPFKLLGAKLVFDQHDICPELYIAKFSKRGIGYWATCICEWLSYKCADLVITANDTFKALCSPRNQKLLQDIVVVRSFPDIAKFALTTTETQLQDRGRVTIGYVGIIGDQDGVETLVRAIGVLREHGISNFICRIVGDGPSYGTVKALVKALDLAGWIELTGYLSGRELLTTLSNFDIGVVPDLKNCYTDNITMNKVFEYMFLAKPIVGFRLRETMDLVGPCGIFAEEERPEALAKAISVLVNDAVLRSELGEAAYNRARRLFSWTTEANKLVEAYDRLRPARVCR
jgi:glycosyltransferase involved in cell wall biosynthesis